MEVYMDSRLLFKELVAALARGCLHSFILYTKSVLPGLGGLHTVTYALTISLCVLPWKTI